LQIREKIKKLFGKAIECSHADTRAARTGLDITIYCYNCNTVMETYNRKAEEWT
jgi:hypothetical protein